jgi:hypothetical protein
MAAPHQDEDRIAGGGAGIGALADNRSMVALAITTNVIAEFNSAIHHSKKP